MRRPIMNKFDLPKISLPRLTFVLPAREPKLAVAINDLKKLTKKVGKGKAFQDRYLHLYNLLKNQTFKPSDIKTAIDIRVFLALANQGGEVQQAIQFSPKLLDAFAQVRSPLSRLSLLRLIEFYFKRFDKSSNDLSYLCRFLCQQVMELEALRSKKNESDLSRYAKYANHIFSVDAPLNIVKASQKSKQDFEQTLNTMGIAAYKNGRLLKVSQTIYYLENLKKIPVGSNAPLLNELIKPEVCNVRYENGCLIGHKVLEILIDRTMQESNDLSEIWQHTILEIAGDPRITSETDYTKWWKPLGQARVAQMRTWLSRYDLKLFLTLLEQNAKDSGKTDMERMFAERKKMLEMLFDHNLIRHSRLFFTADAVNYLRRHYVGKDHLDSYADVSGGDNSIIYLQLTNGWHLIEGTHNFKVRYMDQLPPNSRIANYNKRSFERNEFVSGLEDRYQKAFNKPLFSTAHDAHGKWQFKLKAWLGYTGIELFTNDYRQYRQQYGAL